MTSQKKYFFHIFVLAALALSPLYDVLSKEPNFFLAHKLEPPEFFVLMGMISIVFPLVIAAGSIVFLIPLGRKKDLGIRVLMAFLVAIIILPIAKKVADEGTFTPIFLAGFIGIAFSYLYSKFFGVKLFLKYISPAILIFPILFLFSPKIFVQAFPEAKEIRFPEVSIEGNTPVIFILFDEFQLSALLNENLLIDEVAYPNFSRLASKSHWFRNTSSNFAWTGQAVRSALTGVSQNNPKLGTYRNFPNNLFTLMGFDYQVQGFESALRLCPPHICENQREKKNLEDFKIFWMDMAAIFLNLTLPNANKFGVPGISQSYKNFWSDKQELDRAENKPKIFVKKEFNIPMFEAEFEKEVIAGREELLEKFLGTINAKKRKSFHFLHILLPHMPYRFLSSGKKYDVSGKFDQLGLDLKASKGGTWKKYEWMTNIQYQKFLNQVAYTDHLLGRILDYLETMKIFESSLFVLAADHGVFIKESGLRRNIQGENLGDIAAVPLFIKLPNQNIGKVNDVSATLADIVPTISDVLEIQVPWEMTGLSLLHDSKIGRERIILDYEGIAYRVPGDLKPYLQAGVERKQKLFGKFKDWKSFRLLGEIGKKFFDQAVSEFQVEPLNEIQIVQSTGFQVQAKPDFLPAIFQAEISGIQDENKWGAMFAVNGVFRAGSPLMDINGKKKILSFLPEKAFKDGKNKIEVYLIPKPLVNPYKVFKPGQA